MRVHTPEAGAAETEPAAASEPQRCVKHPDQFVTDKCYVCSKPICPKCMELFGYVCSPLCKAKAGSHGIDVPVYACQKSVMEARAWRCRRAATSAGTCSGRRKPKASRQRPMSRPCWESWMRTE